MHEATTDNCKTMDEFNEMELLLTKYTPLVKATAALYKGRHAEYEDLVQEGYVALMILIPKCKDRQWLSAFLKNHLPGYIRAAARRQGWKWHTKICRISDDIEESLTDDGRDDIHNSLEIREMLGAALSKEERDLVTALASGSTHSELAEQLSMTRQGVSAKVERIRKKLKRYVIETGGHGEGPEPEPQGSHFLGLRAA